jgi:hypothetical protein
MTDLATRGYRWGQVMVARGKHNRNRVASEAGNGATVFADRASNCAEVAVEREGECFRFAS